MSDIIPFNAEGKLPAFLRQVAPAVNSDLTSNVGSGFPYLSIKGKAFTLIRGDEKKMLTRKDEDGDDVPAQSISVVILRGNKNFSKVWYAKQFVEGSDAKPDCYSNNGDTPDAGVENPQSKSCATCKHNAWGSRVTDNGKQGKACQDSRRIAVATADRLNDPMLVRIPPATLKPLAEYGNMLNKRGVPYNAVVTKIKFDPESATPKLTFEALSFLSEDQFKEAEEIAKSSLVDDIIGTGMPLVVSDTQEEKPAPKTTRTAKVEPVMSEESIVEAVERDVETKAAAKAETKEKPAPKTVEIDTELDALLAQLDD